MSSNCCLFCFKVHFDKCNSIEKYQYHQKILKRFIKLVPKYSGSDLSTTLSSEILKSCDDCFGIVESFCTIFQSVKSLELQLDRHLQQLQTKINLAGITRPMSSSFGGGGLYGDGGNAGETLAVFRKELITQCEAKFSSSYPKVRVSNAVASVIKYEPLSHFDKLLQGPYTLHQFSTDWILSLLAVSFLGVELLASVKKVKEPRNNVESSNHQGFLNLSLISVGRQQSLSTEEEVPVHANLINRSNMEVGTSCGEDQFAITTPTCFPCRYCGKKLGTKYKLALHKRPCYNLYKKANRNTPQIPSRVNKWENFDKKFIKPVVLDYDSRYKCTICGWFSYYRSSVRSHVKDKHLGDVHFSQFKNDPIHKCQLCKLVQ